MFDHALAENPNEACGVILGKTLFQQIKDLCVNKFSLEKDNILFSSSFNHDLNLNHDDIRNILTDLSGIHTEIPTEDIKTIKEATEFLAYQGGNEIAKSIIPITNTVKSPYRYQMDPQEFLDADKKAGRLDLSIVAFYHSHTHTPAYPSETDVRLAVESGWIDPYFVLISLENNLSPDLKMYRISLDGSITEQKYSLLN